MTRAGILATGLFASPLTLGCAPDNGGNTTQGATTSTTATSSSDGSGSVTSAPGSATDGTGTDSTPTTNLTTSTSGTTDTSSTGEPCNFLHCDDMMQGPTAECDHWAQDCPEGQKCTAYSSDGGSAWNATQCVDVTGTDKPGDECTTEGVTSGVDSCIKGAMCFYVDEDGVGTCLALCTGGPEAPVCEEGFCTIGGDGVLHLCIRDCDPLLQDCTANGDVCYPIADGFACAPDASGEEGQANDPCEFINVCDKGLMCAEAGSVGTGCMPGATGCCTPFCKFPDGPCPNPDQQCVQYFDPMMFPENDPLLDIGVCGVPD